MIESAIANARVKADEAGERLDDSDLVIKEIYVDEGPTMKRIRPRAQGRAARILKRTSHITVVVATPGRRSQGRGPIVGQKVNPHGYRLGHYDRSPSRWFADSTKKGERYRDYVAEDVKIRGLHVEGHSSARASSKVEIERTRERVRVDIHTARPGIVIGRRGAEADTHPRRPREAHGQAGPAEHPRGQEPRDRRSAGRPGHRRAARLARVLPSRHAQGNAVVACAPAPRASGCRCSGRLGGAEMSRSEFYREGRVPLHTLRANIDYGFFEAQDDVRPIGVKVWIYKGDMTEKEWAADQAKAPAPSAPSRRAPGARRRALVLVCAPGAEAADASAADSPSATPRRTPSARKTTEA